MVYVIRYFEIGDRLPSHRIDLDGLNLWYGENVHGRRPLILGIFDRLPALPSTLPATWGLARINLSV